MSTFVLVHGAWHGGWCWRRVRRLMVSEGHEVYAQSLTGAGERRHLLTPEVGMATYVADVINLIDSEELTDVVLVGHSAAGAVVSSVAQEVPDALRCVVFLDAVVVPHGSSIFDLFGDRWKSEMESAAAEKGEGWLMPPERYRIDYFFGTDCSEPDREWLFERSTPQPIAPYREKLDLERFARLSLEKVYVRCTRSPTGLTREAAQAQGMRYLKIEAGHDAMVSEPEKVAKVLRSLR